jgi:hypothetical protein
MNNMRRELYRRIVRALKSVDVDVHAIQEGDGVIVSPGEGEIEFSLPFEILAAFTGDESDLGRSPYGQEAESCRKNGGLA